MNPIVLSTIVGRALFSASSACVAVMAWSRRGCDAVEKDAPKVLARILPDLAPADIVLLHEATPIAVEVLEGGLRHPVLLGQTKLLDMPESGIRQE